MRRDLFASLLFGLGGKGGENVAVPRYGWWVGGPRRSSGSAPGWVDDDDGGHGQPVTEPSTLRSDRSSTNHALCGLGRLGSERSSAPSRGGRSCCPGRSRTTKLSCFSPGVDNEPSGFCGLMATSAMPSSSSVGTGRPGRRAAPGLQ